MKTNHFTHRLAVVLGLAALSTAGIAHGQAAAETAPGPATLQNPVTAGPDIASADWADISGYTYDTRVQFFAGLKRLEAKVAGQVAELNAKRASMAASANTKEWDFAMKEMENAQTYLKSTGEELGKATPETWGQQKDKVGQAWVRTQDAYGKVKASTTT